MWTGRLGTWWSSLRTTRMSSSRFFHSIHLPRKFLTFSCFLVPFRGLQSDPRVHRWVHLPLDEKQGEQPAAQSGALPQAHWGMGLSSIFATIISLSYLINSSIDSLEDGLEHCLLDHLVPLVIVGRLDHLCNFGFLDISYQIFWAWLTWPTAWSPVWSWDLKRKHGPRHVLQQLHQHQRWTCLRQIESLWYTNMSNLTLPSFNQSQTLTS